MTTMPDVKHSAPEGVLTAYAAGNLPEAFNLVLASHVTLCDEARSRLGALEALGGVVLEADDGVEMPYGSLEATLRLIEDQPREEVKSVSLRKRDDVLPIPVSEMIEGGLDDVKWRAIGGGVKQAILHADKESSARLLYIPGGSEMPDHGHNGLEMTLVLQGAYADEDGRYARGDLEVADQEVEHTPVAEEGEACICLVATNAPLRFNGLLPKIAQPFFRI